MPNIRLVIKLLIFSLQLLWLLHLHRCTFWDIISPTSIPKFQPPISREHTECINVTFPLQIDVYNARGFETASFSIRFTPTPFTAFQQGRNLSTCTSQNSFYLLTENTNITCKEYILTTLPIFLQLQIQSEEGRGEAKLYLYYFK